MGEDDVAGGPRRGIRAEAGRLGPDRLRRAAGAAYTDWHGVSDGRVAVARSCAPDSIRRATGDPVRQFKRLRQYPGNDLHSTGDPEPLLRRRVPVDFARGL